MDRLPTRTQHHARQGRLRLGAGSLGLWLTVIGATLALEDGAAEPAPADPAQPDSATATAPAALPDASLAADSTARPFRLLDPYPNPFMPSTILPFAIDSTAGPIGSIELRIYDKKGRLVQTLTSPDPGHGTHSMVFDASGLPSGVHTYRLVVDGDSVDTKKLVLVK